MITVYGRATSSNVQAVMWGIAELGLTYERLDYGHVYGGTDTPEFRAMNPNGLVPVIRDGDLVMWESCAILRYLGARYGSAPFWPADPVARAPVDMWAEWGKTTLHPRLQRRRSSGPACAPRRRSATRRPSPARSQRFDARPRASWRPRSAPGPYLLGADFTLADIVVGHLLYRYFTLDIPRPDRPASPPTTPA